MTKDIIEQLVEFIGHSNDASEDGDRGRADNALALILFDDGSGRLMIRKPMDRLCELQIDGQQQIFDFDSIEELCAKVREL